MTPLSHAIMLTYMQGFASRNHLPLLKNVTIMGVASKPSVVSVNGKPSDFTSSILGDTIVLHVVGVNVTMDKDFTLDWV